jgi:curved DNA-binding protein
VASKDYYNILGVSKGSTTEEIRSAYRKGARKYHPDVNQSAEAESRFKDINEANEVLKDPEKRKRYDMYGENWQNGEMHRDNSHSYTSSNYRHEDSEGFSDFFRDIFSNSFTESDPFGYRQGTDQARRQPVYEAEITLSLQELLNSETKKISFQTVFVNSQGRVETRERTLNVRIPKGVTDGSTIRLPDIDKEHGNGGDLLLKVNISMDKNFTINGHSLETKVPVTPWEAALGGNIAVKTIDGYVTLKIPPSTAAGKRFRLRGKGLPMKNNGAGDIIVEIVIQIPESLSNEERRLFKELSETSRFDPRNQEQYSSV